MVIPVELGEQSYDIVLKNGALHEAGQELALGRRVLIMTDSGVPEEYAKTVAAQCAQAKIVTVPQGEASKCFEQYMRLLEELLDAEFTRKDCVVAVGGGVVGDLGAFTASTYMRGIDFYNIPTTLLSQVDSSIGGKTGIDFKGLKNVVGSFYQPKKVLIDPETLKTLSRRQLMAGLAEAIKMAASCDAALFALIENSEKLEEDLPEIIRRSLCIKRDIVQRDPKENGVRKALNFGHTIGHAIESFNKGRLLHGECVALGMLPMCAPPVRARLEKTLKKYALPVEIEQNAEELLPYLLHDKKRQGERVTAVLVEDMGSFRFESMRPAEIVQRL